MYAGLVWSPVVHTQPWYWHALCPRCKNQSRCECDPKSAHRVWSRFTVRRQFWQETWRCCPTKFWKDLSDLPTRETGIPVRWARHCEDYSKDYHGLSRWHNPALFFYNMPENTLHSLHNRLHHTWHVSVGIWTALCMHFIVKEQQKSKIPTIEMRGFTWKEQARGAYWWISGWIVFQAYLNLHKCIYNVLFQGDCVFH